MDQYKIELTQHAKENLTDTINTLMQAAQEIANSTEQDFNEMKSKKWYKRLWEVITCSKNNQKTTARGVTNLAKLTEIIMKALLLLADHSEETAKLVSESLNKIENLDGRLEELSLNFKKLALEVKKLKYNYKKNLSLQDLKAEKRDIVGSIFAKYAKLCYANEKMPNEASRNLYAFAMEGDIIEEDIDVSTHLDKIDPDVQKLLYRLNQSYYYLITGDFDDSEYFDDFSVSVKDIRMIRREIEDAVIFSGAENYARTLVPDNSLLYIDADGLVFEEENEETPVGTAVVYEEESEIPAEPEFGNAKPIGLFFVCDVGLDDTAKVCGICDYVINDGEVIDLFLNSEYIGEARITNIEDDNMDIVFETEIGPSYIVTIDTEYIDNKFRGGELVVLQKKGPEKKNAEASKLVSALDSLKTRKITESVPAVNNAPEYVLDNKIGYFNVCDREGSIVSCPVTCDHVIEENEVVNVFNNLTKEYLGEARITKIEKIGVGEVSKTKIGEIYIISIETSDLLIEMNGDDMYALHKKKDYVADRFSGTIDFLDKIEADDKKDNSFDAKQRVFKNYIYDIVTVPSSVEIGGHNKKVRNAISTFAPVINEDDVLGFYDSTVFGSGKSGYLFTTNGIVFKDMGPVVVFNYENIFDVVTTTAKKDCNKTLLVTLDNFNTVEITTISFNKTPLREFLEEMRGLC
ncbi:MAG: hypothetical protein U0L11_09905 [Acutalibacteraceae bacterium]|nr:hypothetical protein [Acutalibacteraceae bacterium]